MPVAPRPPCAWIPLALASLSALASGQDGEPGGAPPADLRGRFEPLYFAPSFDLAWSADGASALVLGGGGPGSPAGVRSFDLATGDSTLVRPAAADEAFERIAFRGERALLWSPASARVRVLDADASAPLELPLAAVPEFLVDAWPPSKTPGGGAADFVLHNRSASAVELVWLPQGGAPRPYAVVPPGGQHRQGSYAGHAWELRSGGASLGRFSVPERVSAALVDASGLVLAPEPASAELDPPDAPGRRQLRATAEGLVLETVRDAGPPRVEPVAAPGVAQDGGFRFFPDPRDRYGLVVREVRPPGREVHYVESAPAGEVQPALRAYPYRKPGDPLPSVTLALVDLDARTARPVDTELFPEPFALDRFRWAPDGSALTFHYNERGHQLYRVVRVDPATASARTLVEERSATFIDYPEKIDLRWLDARGQFLWTSERSGWNQLELRDATSGALARPLTSGAFVVRGIERIDEAAGQVWITVSGVREGEDPYHLHLARVDLDTAEFTLLTAGDGTHAVEFSPDGRYVVDTWSRVDLAPVTELRDAWTGRRVAELCRGDTAALEAAGWRPPLRFRAPGRDGVTPIHGILRLPTHYDPTRSYPVIESIYAGPHGAHVPKAFGVVAKQDELAQLGFIVVQIDGMGTNHRGKAFHDVAWQNLADGGLPDRRAWIEAAAREVPGMDLSRIGIYGGSAGGQNALAALLDHGDFYTVGVADCGCHDNRVDKMWWNELWMGWPVGPHYAAQANATRAHQLGGELLLIVGEADRNVDPASTLQVVDALIRADKDFDLLVMPGVGHGAAETPYGTRRRRDFFVRHLLGREPR